MNKLKTLLTVHKQSLPFSDEKRKVTVILIAVLGLLGVLGWLGFQKFTSKPSGPIEEVDLAFDAEGPYALLYPRRDGNAIVLLLKRTASYDSIRYELAYISKTEEAAERGGKILEESDSLASVVDRGVVGTIDTKEKKGEYEQEILFGTCSKNVCKYDKGVENGTLTLYIKKDNRIFKMVTLWHLQRPDVALGQLTSGDGHFIYQIDVKQETLALVGYSIVNDLTGVPKLPLGKSVLGKVYALNVPITKELAEGIVSLELAENPPADVKLARFEESLNQWEELDTKTEGSKLTAKSSGGGIFAVLISKK